MKPQAIKSRIMYLSLFLSAITILLNYWSIPILSHYFTMYFNLYSAAVILLFYSRFIGLTNKDDVKLLDNKVIEVKRVVLIILAIEFVISLNFQYFINHFDTLFAYAVCLAPVTGFILARPMIRLNDLEVRFDNLKDGTNY